VWWDSGTSMAVKDGVIGRYWTGNPVPEGPYKILFVGSNYVLFAYRIHLLGGSVWTKFGVFAIQRFRNFSPVLGGNSIRWYSCTDDRMKNAEAIAWSRKRFLETFVDRCAKTMDVDKYYPWWGMGWSSSRHYLEEEPPPIGE